MKIFTVLSRDEGDFIYTTGDKLTAEDVRDAQERDEEMAGGRPSVYIRESILENIKMDMFFKGVTQTKAILKEHLGSLNIPDAVWDELSEKIGNIHIGGEELFRHNIVCARATLFPGKTIEEVHKIVDEMEIDMFSEGYGQGLEHGDIEAINNKTTQKAFEDGRLYEAGELELDTQGKNSAFEAWLEKN